MQLLPALNTQVQHFKRIACMFMLLDLAGRAHFCWLHYQVQTADNQNKQDAGYCALCIDLCGASIWNALSLFPPCFLIYNL